MSTATRVPETSLRAAEELSADDAAATLRRVGRRTLLRDSFRRFRYADGFTSARALGFQFVLSFIPLVIAFVGLSSTIRTDRVAETLRRTLLHLSPGSGNDAVAQALGRDTAGGGRLALWVGLLTALVALTTSMGQLERAANRIYGVQRDRPPLRKYGRAAALALGGGLPAMLGFLALVAGGTLLDSLDAVYNWGPGLHTAASWLRWPVGAALDLLAIAVIFRHAPRRRQPQLSWLAVGAGLALALWLAFTGLFTLYVKGSGSFGEVYGPLTGIVALLLWSQLTSVALLLGVAFAAQLEAVRAGVPSPVATDPEATASSAGSVVVLAPEPADVPDRDRDLPGAPVSGAPVAGATISRTSR